MKARFFFDPDTYFLAICDARRDRAPSYHIVILQCAARGEKRRASVAFKAHVTIHETAYQRPVTASFPRDWNTASATAITAHAAIPPNARYTGGITAKHCFFFSAAWIRLLILKFILGVKTRLPKLRTRKNITQHPRFTSRYFFEIIFRGVR